MAVSVDTEKRDEGEDVSPLFNNIVNIELRVGSEQLYIVVKSWDKRKEYVITI